MAFALFLGSSALLTAQDASAASGGQTLWGMVQDGGWAMWPLGACSLALFYLLAHGLSETRRGAFRPLAQLDLLQATLREGHPEQAIDLLNSTETVLGRTLAKAFKKAGKETKAKLEATLAELLEAEAARRLQVIGYLNVIAATAPMIGLLGTVSGMIGAFQTMELVGMGQPQAFAGSISEALITTATGLVIGIPAMVCYYALRNRLNRRLLETGEAASELLDAIDLPQQVEA